MSCPPKKAARPVYDKSRSFALHANGKAGYMTVQAINLCP